ncbi:hypothetical protein [Caballeronia sp. INDeC2]|uniref:hypothetical protein n=1 Tax=Caballeronia sp. INDeC2 TaxID=2921747 RepID=UPI00202965DA|nr:hypothetical protein [Caballeronia sp. INDeC2]
MTPIESQPASRAVRTPIVQRSPAGWRAFVRGRRAWLIAAELHLRQHPHSRRAKGLAPVLP